MEVIKLPPRFALRYLAQILGNQYGRIDGKTSVVDGRGAVWGGLWTYHWVFDAPKLNFCQFLAELAE